MTMSSVFSLWAVCCGKNQLCFLIYVPKRNHFLFINSDLPMQHAMIIADCDKLYHCIWSSSTCTYKNKTFKAL